MAFAGVPKVMIQRLGWTTASFGAGQGLRLLSNLILAQLLTPTIFGIMLIVNSIKTGIELLSDVGLVQSIISNPRGSNPDFYDTAWTLQAARGLLLGAAVIALAYPLASYFEHPELARILPVASFFFIFTGFDSLSRALLQKNLQLKRLAAFQTFIALFSLIAHVSVALITPTVWALVLGGVLTAAATLVSSFLMIPGLRHRLRIDLKEARAQLRFGRWVFVSSIIFFLAMNFDRLYLAKQISLAQLGVYGIARGLADLVSLVVQRGATFVLYPMVASAGVTGLALRLKLLRGRRSMLLGAALLLGLFLAMSDRIIGLLYDARYAEGALILPILIIGTWFGILTATSDAILMGLSRPGYTAASNAAKLASYVIGVPLAYHWNGFFAAVAVISGGEMVKYVTLWWLSHREHLRFGRDDAVLTLMFLFSAALFREALHLAGLVGEFGTLFSPFLGYVK